MARHPLLVVALLVGVLFGPSAASALPTILWNDQYGGVYVEHTGSGDITHDCGDEGVAVYSSSNVSYTAIASVCVSGSQTWRVGFVVKRDSSGNITNVFGPYQTSLNWFEPRDIAVITGSFGARVVLVGDGRGTITGTAAVGFHPGYVFVIDASTGSTVWSEMLDPTPTNGASNMHLEIHGVVPRGTGFYIAGWVSGADFTGGSATSADMFFKRYSANGASAYLNTLTYQSTAYAGAQAAFDLAFVPINGQTHLVLVGHSDTVNIDPSFTYKGGTDAVLAYFPVVVVSSTELVGSPSFISWGSTDDETALAVAASTDAGTLSIVGHMNATDLRYGTTHSAGNTYPDGYVLNLSLSTLGHVSHFSTLDTEPDYLYDVGTRAGKVYGIGTRMRLSTTWNEDTVYVTGTPSSLTRSFTSSPPSRSGRGVSTLGTNGWLTTGHYAGDEFTDLLQY